MTQGYPITPPFYLTGSYQNSQYGSQGSIYAPAAPSVYEYLVNPPASGVAAEAADQAVTEAVGWVADTATNCVQVVTLNGSPTGGTFVLVFGDAVTSALAWNASNSAVQAALRALSSIGSGNVTVTGANGGPFTVTFTGALAATAVQPLGGDGSLLTGPSTPYQLTGSDFTYTTPVVTVAVTTAGHAAFSSPYTATTTTNAAGPNGQSVQANSIANTKQQYDPVKNQYDSGSGNYSGAATPSSGPLW